MNSPFVAEIRPHRYGWVCALPSSGERVFVLRPHAIQFACAQCSESSGEILVRNRNGEVEKRLRIVRARESAVI